MQKLDLNEKSDRLCHDALAILIEKKALDVRAFRVGESSSITDFYINVTGRSMTNVASLADELVYELEMKGIPAARVEGKRGAGWILVDYGTVIVNVFDRTSRDFYNLDRLLPEDGGIDLSEIVSEVDEKLGVNKNQNS